MTHAVSRSSVIVFSVHSFHQAKNDLTKQHENIVSKLEIWCLLFSPLFSDPSTINFSNAKFFHADGLFQREPFLTAHTCFDASNLGKTQRVRHSQVPVQWYTAKKGDADVDIRVEDEAKKLAALLSMDPVIMLQEVIDPQGKSGDVEEVCHWQVDQVNAKLVALPYLEGWENAEEEDGMGDTQEGWVRKEGKNSWEQKEKCMLEQGA